MAELFSGNLVHPFRRALWLVGLLPLLLIKAILDGCFLLLDEVFFPKVKDLPLRAPVFVVGPPRSGTTFLHRVLAEDRDHFVTSPAWEVFLAPSILQKKALRGLLAVDKACGRPLVRGVRWAEGWVFRTFETTHPGSLADAEEDYFYLSSVCSCTGWMLAFPAWKILRKGMPGQPEHSHQHRKRALYFYRSCLQKQQVVDGNTRTVLCKNASFSSWMDLMPEVFPEARYIVCMRDPLEAVPSMLSTAGQTAEAVAATSNTRRLPGMLVEEMKAHYQCLYEVVPTLHSAVVVAQPELKTGLESVVRTVAEVLSLEFSPSFWQTLSQTSEQSQRYRSPHRYALEDFHLSAEMLRQTCPTLDPTTLHDPS